MKNGCIRVLVVDDHRLMRDGIACLIGRQKDFKIAALAATGEEAITLFRALRPDVVLMDLRLPRMSGVEATRAIRRDDSAARIVMLTAYESAEDVYQALEAGAATYLLKDMLPSALAQTIRDVVAGERPLGPEIEALLAERNRHEPLTSREIEIVTLVARGMRNKEIGSTLQISHETVHVHLRRIYSKLKVSDRTAMIAEATRRGILHMS